MLTHKVVSFFIFIYFFAAVSALFAEDVIKHKLLLLDESRGQLLYVDQFTPSKDWHILLDSKARDLQLIGNNRILTALPDQGGYREYDLTTQKIVKEFYDCKKYRGIMSAARFPDGRTVLACDQRGTHIFILDKDDKETAAFSFPKFEKVRLVRRTVRNTLLFSSNADHFVEIDIGGKIVRNVLVPNAKYNYHVAELPNGNVLTAAGYGGFVAEIDKDGTPVKQYGGKPEPKGLLYIFMSQFQVLKNGHLVVATWTGHGANDSSKGQQVVEFDKDGKAVWTWHDAKLAGSIHGVLVLDELDTEKFYDDTSL